MPGRPCSASTDRPLSSASAGRPRRSAASRAFRSALSTKVLPISSGSGRPSSAAPTHSMPCGASSSWISRSLPALWVAMTSLGPIAFICPTAFNCSRKISVAAHAREPQQAQQPFLVETFALGGQLRLDDRAVAGQHEIAVAAGLAVLVIVEVEHRLAVVDAAADRRDLGADRVLGQLARGQQLVDRDAQRHPGAGDGRGAGAAVGLDHVAIDDHLPLAELGQVDHGAQASGRSAAGFPASGPTACPWPPRGCRGCGWRGAACHIRR